jgi:phosphoenolpyruvate-protein phosphotransferase
MSPLSSNALQVEFSCPLPSGFHARPASQLVEIANQFAAECVLTNLRNSLNANGKSVLGIIAADIRHGDPCVLSISGPDETEAQATLRRFVDETLPRCDVPLTEDVQQNAVSKPARVLQGARVPYLSGIAVSRGIGQGIVVIAQRIVLPKKAEPSNNGNPKRELERVQEAVTAVRDRIGEKLKYSITPMGTAVLQADLAIAGDVLLIQKLRERIQLGKSAAHAVVDTGEFFMQMLGNSPSEYIRQRAADIEEICVQLLEELGEAPRPSPVEFRAPSVLVAEMLAPQQILELDRTWLKAIVLEHAAATSHAAILARSLGIPTLAGIRNARMILHAGSEVIVDANRGFVVTAISNPVQRFYEQEHQTLQRRQQMVLRDANRSAVTADGKAIEVAANASTGEEATVAFANGADGIGLFRTEMIFLSREQPPSEEEQTAIYTEVVRVAAGRPVIIRSFDIGGDKKAPYLNLPREDNPFLGYRGARIYAEYHQLLQGQLRAILRASAAGPVQIMAPMISSVEEIVEFSSAVEQAKQSLLKDRTAFRSDIKVGMMVEVPSVAFAVEQLSTEVDFFSIGTNDLSQYFFAADRGNPRVSSRFSVQQPGFLRYLRDLTEQIHRAGKWLGMCGEMAGDLRNLPLLLGLGLDEISVPAAEVHRFKRAVAVWNAADCAALLDRAIICRTTREVEELLNTQPRHETPRPLLEENLVQLSSTSLSKEEVIKEMVDALYATGRTDDREMVEEALWGREAMGPTSLGYGFAIPHCKTDGVVANSICVLRLSEPIDWDHNEAVNVVVLLALREADVANIHMQIFSLLARKLMNEDFRQHLLHAPDAHQVTTYLSAQLGIEAAGVSADLPQKQ